MRNITLVLILLTNINIVFSQNELPLSLLKIDLPISHSENINSSISYKEELYNLRYYISPFIKRKSKQEDSLTKFQIQLDSKVGYLCDILEDCENMFYQSNNKEVPNILEIQNRYSNNIKNKYDVFLYPDSNTSLRELEKITKIFYQIENIENVYFAYSKVNDPGSILFYNFKPNDNFNLVPLENGKYSDWVSEDFKVEYGEV